MAATRALFVVGWLSYLQLNCGQAAEPLPVIAGVEAQPVTAAAKRVVQSLELLGSPMTPDEAKAFELAVAEPDPGQRVAKIQQVLDPRSLAMVQINPESRVKVLAGTAPAELMQHGWRTFLVKVHNEAGVTAPLRVASPNALPMVKRSTSAAEPRESITPSASEDRWLDVASYEVQPLAKQLSGLPLEYRIVELYSRDAGKREAKLMFDVGQGTQDLGFRNELNVLFQCVPAVAVELEVRDTDGQPTTGRFVFRDTLGRIYPARSRRLAPDFFFHDQVYRGNTERVLLPPGKFQVTFTRGPEYRVLERTITVPEAKTHRETFQLERWIKLADFGWYSGDHHVHAAGCSHYEAPTEGVEPLDMMRHILGEDLNVGCVLSWGPCWYHQKEFFEGQVSRLSKPFNLMRYDVEVSGFPSSHAGHICLLRLKEDDYPGTSRIDQWPTWDLPIFRWAKEQGGVVGFAHSGWGLQVTDTKLPSYEMPRFDGIGANEFIVDTVHGACDFISTVDTPYPWELNIWYHTLNSGCTTRISGETDFPCIYGERVGLGRSYVKLDSKRGLQYDDWAEGLRDGRCYVSDGLGHLIDFEVGGLGVGQPGADGKPSVLAFNRGQKLPIHVHAAALLDERPHEEIRGKPVDQKPYWHVERARLGNSRQVPVELIINGQVVEQRLIEADGRVHPVNFMLSLNSSSWVAVRILPSAHTNPVFVEIDGKPIRASRKSAQWCLDAVDVCWHAKLPRIAEKEREAAAAAYDVARQYYRKVLGEAVAD